MSRFYVSFEIELPLAVTEIHKIMPTVRAIHSKVETER